MEFSTLPLSYMQAAMVHAMMTQRPEKLRIKKVPQGTPKENVDFVRTHQELSKQLDAELKAAEPSGSE